MNVLLSSASVVRKWPLCLIFLTLGVYGFSLIATNFSKATPTRPTFRPWNPMTIHILAQDNVGIHDATSCVPHCLRDGTTPIPGHLYCGRHRCYLARYACPGCLQNPHNSPKALEPVDLRNVNYYISHVLQPISHPGAHDASHCHMHCIDQYHPDMGYHNDMFKEGEIGGFISGSMFQFLADYVYRYVSCFLPSQPVSFSQMWLGRCVCS